MKKSKKILILLVILGLFLPQRALAYSQYIGNATSYYIHPVTGVIEDAGNNPGIGQGMTENVLHPQALLEEVNGAYYLTCRFHLKEYISGESFAVQNREEQDFYAVNYEVTAETAETKDYRFQVPSPDMIVRSTFFVGPMGRDVIFYFDVGSYVEGNTDFVAIDIQDSQPQTQAPAQSQVQNPGQSAGQAPPGQSVQQGQPSTSTGSSIQDQFLTGNEGKTSPVTSSSDQPGGQDPSTGQAQPGMPGPGANFQPGEKIETKAVNEDYDPGDLGYDHGLLMRGSPELEAIFHTGSEGKDPEAEEEKEWAPMGPFTKAIIYILLAILIIVTLGSMILAIATYAYRIYLERKVETLNEEVYQD